MPNKMLIDAAHPEETRVVVLRGNRVEEFDFEAANRKPLRGNIYLAKVTRVEPSLQAAFVDYGGNRHGFLAFSEIHPDYYQIPVADRQALIEAEEAEIAEAEARQERRQRGKASGRSAPTVREEAASEEDSGDDEMSADGDETGAEDFAPEADEPDDEHGEEPAEIEAAADADTEAEAAEAEADADEAGDDEPVAEAVVANDDDEDVQSDDAVDSVGAEDAMEEVPERRKPRARQYKIQEVIKRRQVLLVQVVKEERGNKGAALTTYLSLAGRYSVLMPNTARGGGISRKITSVTDRKRLKQVVSDLEVPTGMGVILRTAGAARTRAEVKRDFEYLLRLWENVRELTLESSAPTLVYEEGSLIKRSIRDLYNKDIDEVLVAGDDAYREAKDFMRMLMPSHAKNVKPYKESTPILARSGIEGQLDAMFSPQVSLRSGGYMVINQTEALVAIDVNSGRATREHNIEDTALQTNLEAAEEVARQLRLRDLAGLIVIDFIDMEEKRNNRSVERKMKDALKHDRARIQVGRISHFGLLEMSRQRIRTGVLESTTSVCPTCQGTGHVRSPASVALHVLRSLEDLLQKGVTHNLTIRTRSVVALYILNQKRQTLAEIEQRFGLTITVSADESINNGQHFVIERGEQVVPRERSAALVTPASVAPVVDDEDEEETVAEELVDEEIAIEDEAERPMREDGQGSGRRRRRRRGRRGGSDRQQDGQQRPQADETELVAGEAGDGDSEDGEIDGERQPRELGPDGQPRKRRRGRRGGRRGRRGRGGEGRPEEAPVAASQNSDEAEAGFAGAFGDDYSGEIDTTPRLDDPRPDNFIRPAEVLPSAPDEVDTTPQPVERASAPPAAEPPAPPPPAPETEAEDPSRPKRSGWWQRRSFFG